MDVMKDIELNLENPEYNQKRVEALNRILSGKEPVRIDDVTIEIKGPEYGWLEIYLKVEGKRPFIMEVSDVYPPFPDLRSWLEHMVNYTTYPSESLVIDCERYNVLLSYDYLGHVENDEIYEPVALLQIGVDIPEEDETGEYEPLLQIAVPIRKFVSDLYNVLKNYMYDNRKVFSQNWSHPNGGDFDIRKLMRSFASKKIEEDLERMGAYTCDLSHGPCVQIK